MQKLSIIRFKPKPECFDEFVSNITELLLESLTMLHLKLRLGVVHGKLILKKLLSQSLKPLVVK